MNKHLMTDMADANGLQRAIRPTRFFNIKKIATDFCSAQCIMDNTGSLILLFSHSNQLYEQCTREVTLTDQTGLNFCSQLLWLNLSSSHAGNLALVTS